MAIAKAPPRFRLIVRVSLTAIFAVAMVIGFAVGRPVVGVIMLGFLGVSIALLVFLFRERSALRSE
jgi:hypothetical protein